MVQDFFIYITLGFLTTLLGFLIFLVFRLKRKLDIFLRGGNKDFEGVLRDLIEKSEIREKEMKEIFERILRVEEISKISFQKVGVVRYNPFKDVGGDQSFSIALLDSKDSGFVITALYMREGNRIFAKSIVGGKSEYPLSEEEKRAIEQAIACK